MVDDGGPGNAGEIEFELTPIETDAPAGRPSSLDGEDEVLAVGAPRHAAPGWSQTLRTRLGRVPTPAWLAVLVVAVLAVVAGRSLTGSSRAPQAAPSSSAAEHPAPAPAPVTAAASASPDDSALDELIYLAETPNSISGTFRADATGRPCPTPPAGSDPITTVTQELGRTAPGFTVSASASTVNADDTLCGLDLRATEASGAVLIVQISAPPFGYGPPMQAQRSNDRSTAVDVATYLDGWRVEVGWAGETGTQVTYAELETIAADPHLRW